ncbi:MAG: DEAD/DEAH box helicase family protein [Actinobacteria bacterium]|nr:DEAD/DEAH box helicase family protein [Actinomycetota bacterium]
MSAVLEQDQGDELLDGPGELFKKIRNHISTSQGQGQVFERLIKAFLKEDPLFKERFKQVWLWSEWPGRQGEHDSGIDLVAEESDGGVCAIQCKFYGENKYIGRSDIDTFLARSGKRPFTSRLFVSTTEHWSTTAEKVLANQQVPVQKIGIAELANSPFDWSRFDPEHPDQLFKHAPKEIRPHQRKAIDDVKSGFETTDRGKLIMACGTGKTFTALRLAEEIVPSGGSVLFCVPSISLLSQTLRAWTSDATRPLHAMAVCSDAQVTRDSEDMHIYDLALPATTSPEKIVEHLRLAKAESENEENPLLVVFSTYQSLDRIAEAQERGAPVFDLVIADEAHRTTGSRLVGEDDTGFTIIHNNQSIQSKRRLYMTATPRLYSDKVKKKAKESDVVLCSMDDEKLYGPVFHHLGFGRAVDQLLLSDYRVIILMVDEKFVSKVAHEPLADSDIELVLQDAARLVGVWRGLSKQETSREQLKGDGFDYDPAPMRRAVAFSTTIAASKQIQRTLPTVVDSIRNQEEKGVVCEAEHVDGTMGAQERERKLAWLREDPPDGVCRVLTNARCLSEGVDVPALDAVIFIQPRKSQIDVVQAVGRVMRRAEGKRYGYVIIPVPIPSGEDPERVLDDNKRYQVVWQVLQALRAHDDRFDAEINKLDLQKNHSGRIQVVGVGGKNTRGWDNLNYQDTIALSWQGLEDKVYARVVKHCGTRTYWEDWAEDVAQIASSHITRIKTAIETNNIVAKAFESYLAGLHKTINPSVTEDEAIEMIAQHLITYPVFEALFGDSKFVVENPVSRSMADVLEQLHEEEAIAQERAELAEFYSSVRTRAERIDNLESRQKVIKELYEVFFQRAFPKAADRLGIVYTPTEIIDFMLKSVNQALSDEFNTKLGAKNVHILDPFTGTGTFLVKLLSLLDKRDLQRTYNEFLHANEIVLLAYYIAAINIEQTYHTLMGEDRYEPFPGIVLTDTFQLGEDDSGLIPEFLRPNSERAQRQKKLPITVIVGNPPYSVGQGSENDNNKNLKYENLDKKIRTTYAAHSNATLKNSLYDSYIRAFRWASDRIGDKGVVCFVTNGAFIGSASADGFRKALAKEYSDIYCLNLRGNQRTAGEVSRREGGKVFGSGSRAPIAITLLIKNPDHEGPANIYYHDIGDYLTREDKLARLQAFGDISGVPWQEINPDEAGDWINKRTDEFAQFMPMGNKNGGTEDAMFTTYSGGVKTNRDAWAYNFSKPELLKNMDATIKVYEEQRKEFSKQVDTGILKRTSQDVDRFVDTDPTKVSWSSGLKNDLYKNKPSRYDSTRAVVSLYRPFCKQWLYLDRQWNERVLLIPSFFPTPAHENKVIAIPGIGSRSPSVLIVECVPDIQLAFNGQCFPRYHYAEPESNGQLLEDDSMEDNVDEYGYIRHDAISLQTLESYQKHYGINVTADDIFDYIYGILHSPEYRNRFASDLGKMIPRIPMVDAFQEFVTAGHQLAELHLSYESIEPYPLDGMPGADAGETDLRVKKMRYGKTTEGTDRTVIVVNDHITLSGIPVEAQRYDINGRSALDWLIDRYQVKTDKDSGITNDPNAWGIEHEDPRYIVDLVARIVRVSVETMEVVDGLAGL